MEKYGTIPPRFTKAWWAHYWFYYKYHVIAIAVAIIVVGGSVKSCLTAPNYDLQVQYLADFMPADESIEALNAKLCELTSDATENGKNEAVVHSQISMGDGPEAAQYNYAIQMKMIAELEAGEMGIYIMDKNFAETLTGYEALMPVSEWAENYSEEDLYNPGVLSLAGNPLLTELGFTNTDNLYIGVLRLYDRKADDAEYVRKHENAKIVANMLIKE